MESVDTRYWSSFQELANFFSGLKLYPGYRDSLIGFRCVINNKNQKVIY